uniref:Uncharacterized protein n=1 Tax=Tetraselmis sp. GSL018 TaxID=582737 RepID=A0A061RVJ0_9CHLO
MPDIECDIHSAFGPYRQLFHPRPSLARTTTISKNLKAP